MDIYFLFLVLATHFGQEYLWGNLLKWETVEQHQWYSALQKSQSIVLLWLCCIFSMILQFSPAAQIFSGTSVWFVNSNILLPPLGASGSLPPKIIAILSLNHAAVFPETPMNFLSSAGRASFPWKSHSNKLKFHKWPKPVYCPKLWHQHIKISAQ